MSKRKKKSSGPGTSIRRKEVERAVRVWLGTQFDEGAAESLRGDMRAVLADFASRRGIGAPEVTDTERLDRIQALLDKQIEVGFSIEELLDDDDKPFIGISVYTGPRGHFHEFRGGSTDLRGALDEAATRHAPNSEDREDG